MRKAVALLGKYISIKQLFIQFIILTGIPITTLFILLYTAPSPSIDGRQGDVGLGCAIMAIAVAYILFLFLIGETVYRYCKKEMTKVNANMLLIIIGIAIGCFF